MRRAVTILFVTLFVVQAALAQQRKPSVPMVAVCPAKELSSEWRIRYLLRQLELTKEQREQARGLFATIIEVSDSFSLSLEEVRAVATEIQEAEAAGDEERAEQLGAELREMAYRADRETEFFLNMEPLLTKEQKIKLEKARGRLKRNPAGALRPVDVFRAARQLDLSRAQHAELDRVHEIFRNEMGTVSTLTDDARFQLMNGLLQMLKKQLTPEQREEFELSVRRLRPDLVPLGLHVTPPKAPPAAEQPEQPEEEPGEAKGTSSDD